MANEDAERSWQDYLLDNKGLDIDFDRDHMMPIKTAIFVVAIFLMGAVIYFIG